MAETKSFLQKNKIGKLKAVINDLQIKIIYKWKTIFMAGD
jgi:hypothetical protein